METEKRFQNVHCESVVKWEESWWERKERRKCQRERREYGNVDENEDFSRIFTLKALGIENDFSRIFILKALGIQTYLDANEEKVVENEENVEASMRTKRNVTKCSLQKRCELRSRWERRERWDVDEKKITWESRLERRERRLQRKECGDVDENKEDDWMSMRKKRMLECRWERKEWC